jgi:hypothetical protein
VPPLVKIETPLAAPLFHQVGSSMAGPTRGTSSVLMAFGKTFERPAVRTRTYIEGGKIATPQQKTIAGGNC